MPDIPIRTTAEIRAEIEEHQQRLAELRGQLDENARACEAKQATRDERIADGGAGVPALNRAISDFRIEAEGLTGGIKQLERRIVERETEVQSADLRERQADCDAAVARAVRSIEALHAVIITFIAETFGPQDVEMRAACETARQAENHLSAATGQRTYGTGQVYEQGWRHHPGLLVVDEALRSFAPTAPADAASE